MPIIRSIFGVGEDIARRLRMPEFYLGETVRGKYDTGQRFNVGQGLSPEQGATATQRTGGVEPYVSNLSNINLTPNLLFKGASVPTTTGAWQGLQQGGILGPTGASSKGVTGVPSGGGAAGAVSKENDYGALLEQEMLRARNLAGSEIGKLPKTYADIYSPIYEGLQSQLDALGGQRGELTGFVERGAEARGRGVETERERLLTQLTGQAGRVEETGKKTLREMAEDIRNQMQAGNVYMGQRGAGDSSAAGLMTEAIQKSGMKRRGDIMEQTNQQLSDIDMRKTDVTSLVEQKLQEIEASKQEQLYNLASQFQNIQRELESKRQTANSQELASIAEQESTLQSEMRKRLNELNDQVMGAKYATEEWNRDRQAELEDFAAKLVSKGTYTGEAKFSKEMQAALDYYNRLADSIGIEQARRQATQEGYEKLTGYIFGTDEDPLQRIKTLTELGELIPAELRGRAGLPAAQVTPSPTGWDKLKNLYTGGSSTLNQAKSELSL